MMKEYHGKIMKEAITMKKPEAQKQFQHLKATASFKDNHIVFNDNEQKIFIKHLFWSNCRVYSYSDVEIAYIYQKTGSIHKGHPYLGAAAGQALSGGSFAAGMIGAMAGQNMPGKDIKYVEDPMLIVAFHDGYQYQEILMHGISKEHTVRGWITKNYLDLCQKECDRVMDAVYENI